MKKGLLGVLFLLIMGALVWAGGSQEAAADFQGVELKMGLVANSSSLEYQAAEKFAALLSERTGGKVTVALYPGSKLGDDRAMLEQVSAGVLDMTFGETGRFGLWVPYAEVFQLPFVFENFDHIVRSTETDFGKKLQADLLENGWVLLANAYNGTRQTSSNKPIRSIDDMKGMKLRVPNAKANLDFAKYSGASPVPMAFGEVYLALKTNAVDGQENPLPAINAMKFYEVQDYIALTGHIINDQNYVFSARVWEKLPEDIQAIIEKTAQDAAAYHTELFVNNEAELLSFFESEGVTLTRPDRGAFREASRPIIEEYNGKFGTQAMEAIDSVR